MTKNHGLLFRQYVPSLVACLEDADSAVRDTARLVVVELFRYVEIHILNTYLLDTNFTIQECSCASKV
jgi:vesicle coat complex subunit